MSGPTRAAGRRVLTPAVLAAAAFTTFAALGSVLFVTARGGLEMPLAATSAPPAAVASPGPPTPTATAAATLAPVPPSPTVAPTAGPSSGPEPTPAPSPTAPGPPDPLLALAGCPGHPGCYLYTVRRGDSYTGISDRYGVLLWIMDALNPEVSDKQVIVVGQTLYLGHDPTARLDLCPDGSCHLYAVRSGDTLARIAGRYGLSVDGIRALNPGLDPTSLVPGQVIRLPLYEAT